MDPAWSESVCDFWFAELGPKAWFEKNESLDQQIRDRFAATYQRLAATKDIESLLASPKVTLAAAIVLDQFPRNMFRGTARMFESDPKALALAAHTVERGLDMQVPIERRLFLYLPFEHSEQIADQDRSVELIAGLADPMYLSYAEAHRAIIRRFGRFPHRNALLGRPSTPQETSFLAEPGSSF